MDESDLCDWESELRMAENTLKNSESVVSRLLYRRQSSFSSPGAVRGFSVPELPIFEFQLHKSKTFKRIRLSYPYSATLHYVRLRARNLKAKLYIR